MSWKQWIKNAGAITLAPATGGLSLGLIEDNASNSILDNITGAKSAREQEKRQKQYQDETNNLSIELANTAHQREVADLQAAGLNPVLSAGGNGATTPTLGTATAVNEMPGGYLAQAGQAAQIYNLAGSAKQALANASLTKTQEQLQPAIAQSEIDKNNSETALNLTNAANAGTKTTAMINDEKLAKSWWGRNISPILRDVFGGGAGQTVANTAVSARNASKMANAIKNKPAPVINHYH